MLMRARDNESFVDYLTYIFRSPDLGDQVNLNPGSLFLVRYAAAIQLKNHLKDRYTKISKAKLDQVKAATLSMLQDPNGQLRGFAGTIITQIVQQGGVLQWPEILQELISLVSNSSGNITPETQEGAMSALAKVCEDNRKLLDKEFAGQKPMTVIVPKMLEFANHPNSKIRVFALGTLKQFIPQKSQVLISNINSYLQKIFERASDPDVQVRRIVCQSLVQLVESYPDLLAPNMEGLVNYILTQQQSAENSELALDAAEFWLTIGEQEQLRGMMAPYLDRVIPVLLAGMVYGEEDVFRLGGDQDDADQEDRVEDIKPQFAAVKAGRTAASGPKDQDTESSDLPNGTGNQSKADLSDGEVEESDYSDEDDWDDDDPENAWSLRKCSAAALDVFAVNYGQDVFNIILPYLKENLTHNLWPKREAAVLALGAIAEGCLPVVAPHLPELVPFLISLLADEEPVVRQITCWCLARYSEWAAELDPEMKTKYFEPMMEGLLQRMLDKNKKVQEAGASSFATLEEKASTNLKPYVEPILRQFTQCFQRYKDKNMYILYDCLQTLADSVGSEMAKPELIDLLMPVLIQRWNKIEDSSREMFPLLGCLGYIAIAYGSAFSPFAAPIFGRCIKLIFANLQQHMNFMSGASVDEPDKDFIVTALDLLSAIIQAIPPASSTDLINSASPHLYDLLSFTMEDPVPDVRQSAYALLGDCALAVYPTLGPYLPKLLPHLIRQIDLDLIRDDDSDTGFNVLINVCWSTGEIAAQTPPDKPNVLTPVLSQLYAKLIEVISNEAVPDAADENAALALGRLGLCCPDDLAPNLPQYAPLFLASMSKITTSHEKASAFIGLNNVIQRNPEAMETVLANYFEAVAAFPVKSNDESYVRLRESSGAVMRGFKGLLGSRWEDWVGGLKEGTGKKVREGYGL
jgi:transportin-1